MYRTSKFLLLFLVISFFTFTSALSAQPLKVYVLQSAPLGYIGANGQPTGEHWDYIKAIADRAGVEVEMKLAPKARIFADIKNGRIDMAIFFRASKRDKVVDYVGRIRQIKIVAINRKGLQLKNYEDLYNSKKIGIMKNTFFGKKFDNDSNLNKTKLTKYENMVKMLGVKRIDTATGNAIVLSYQFNKFNLLDKIELPGYTLGKKEQWLQMSKKSTNRDKLAALQKAVKELSKDGTFDKILTKHVGSTWEVINKI